MLISINSRKRRHDLKPLVCRATEASLMAATILPIAHTVEPLLKEIVVTVWCYEQTPQTTPALVVVVDGEQPEAMGLTGQLGRF